MKISLLEWLEDRRNDLEDGVYSVSENGGVYRNFEYMKFTSGKVQYSKDKYKVENGEITLVENSKITFYEWLINHFEGLKNGIYKVDGRGVIFHGNLPLHQKQSVMCTNEVYKFKDGNLYHMLGNDEQLVHSVNSRKSALDNKYNRKCKGITIDVYDVIKAFDVTCPALQHLIKKALCTGLRGHKSQEQDLQDILDSAKRAVELGNEK